MCKPDSSLKDNEWSLLRMRQSLARNAVYSVLYRLLNVVFPLISAGYVARVLSPDGVGRVAYAQNIVSYFVMFAALGIPSYGTREIAKRTGDDRGTDVLFSELFILNAISTSICLFLYFLTVQLMFQDNAVLFQVIGLELVFNYLNIDWFYQGKEKYVYITKRSIVIKVLSLIALCLFVKDRQDCIAYAFIYSIGIGCNYCFNMIHVRKYVRFTLHNLKIRQHLTPIMWLMFSSVAASLYSKVDITMLGAMASEESVAYYTNAHKIIGAVLALVTSISAVFLPRLSYVYVNDKKQYEQYLSLGLKVILLLAVPACAGVFIIAENLMITLFGEAFLSGAGVLKTLSVFTIVKGAGDLLCYQAIISSGRERVLVSSRIAAGIANVLLNAVLIPQYGHNGAAIASLISELIVNGVLLYFTLSYVKLDIGKSVLISIAFSAAVMAAAVVSMQERTGTGTFSLCVSVLTGMVVYGGMLIITRNELIGKIIQKYKK